MFSPENPQNFKRIDFLPAVFKANKSGWLIEYYVTNPETKKLCRKQIRLKRLSLRYKKEKDAISHINKIINNINEQLKNGWNPFFESEELRFYTPIFEVLDKFILEKEKELRETTIQTYKSFIGALCKFVQDNSPNLYSSMFTETLASKFMDYAYIEKNLSSRSYNNYLKQARLLFNWMIEKSYCKTNPFQKLKTKKKQPKKRGLIPFEKRVLISDYLKREDSGFLTVCKLIYTSLLRPKEIRELKIENVKIKDKYILVPAEVSKNGKSRIATISQDIIEDFLKMELSSYPDNYYLFGLGYKPNIKKSSNARFRKDWDKLRKKLNLPEDMQLYSFRDTGIFEMLKSGIDDLTVMQHADHHSLDMTTIYANHADPNLIKKVYENAPNF